MSVHNMRFQTRIVLLTFYLGASMPCLQAMQKLVAGSAGSAKQAVGQKELDVKPEEMAAYRTAWHEIEGLYCQNNFSEVKKKLSQLSTAYPTWGKKVFYRPCGEDQHGNLIYFMQRIGYGHVSEFGFNEQEMAEFASQLKESRKLIVGPYIKKLRKGTAAATAMGINVRLMISDAGRLLAVSAGKPGDTGAHDTGETVDWNKASEVALGDLADPGLFDMSVSDVGAFTALIQALEKK